MRGVIWLQNPTVFWLGGGTISVSYWMYMGKMMLGRQKYTQQNHLCLSWVPWGWVGFWRPKKSQITRYWSIPSGID